MKVKVTSMILRLFQFKIMQSKSLTYLDHAQINPKLTYFFSHAYQNVTFYKKIF